MTTEAFVRQYVHFRRAWEPFVRNRGENAGKKPFFGFQFTDWSVAQI